MEFIPYYLNKSVLYKDLYGGGRVFQCRGNHNPVSYCAADGQIRLLDLASSKDTFSANVNGIHLKDKNIRTVGFRKDGLRNKYIGIRPDDCQGGSEQLEFTIERIEFDGKEMPIDLSKQLALDTIRDDLGSVIVQSTRQGCRQMVKVDSPIKGFRIIFTIHMKGLYITPRPDIGEYWIYSKKDNSFRFRICAPKFVDSKTYEPITSIQDMIQHTIVDNGNDTLTYTKKSSKVFDGNLLPESYLIDSDIAYSTTADGFVYKTNADWTVTRSAEIGTGVDSSSSTDVYGQASLYSAGYYIFRSFWFYSLVGISGTISAVTSNIYGFTNQESSVTVQLGTQSDTIGTVDFDAFSGSYYGNVAWDSTKYNIISFNAQGIIDTTSALGGEFKLCTREKTYDYDSADPGENFYQNGVYYSNNTGTDKDPYLEITTGAAAGEPAEQQIIIM